MQGFLVIAEDKLLVIAKDRQLLVIAEDKQARGKRIVPLFPLARSAVMSIHSDSIQESLKLVSGCSWIKDFVHTRGTVDPDSEQID